MDKGFLGTILLDTHYSAGLGSASIRAIAEIYIMIRLGLFENSTAKLNQMLNFCSDSL